MRVAYLTNIPSPYRVSFFNELGKYCDLTVLYERKTAKNRNSTWYGNETQTFKDIYLNSIKLGNDVGFSIEIINVLKNKNFDLVIIGQYSSPTGMLAIQYLKKKNKAFILNADGGIIAKENKIKKIVKSYFISSANAWLSTGVETSKYFIHYKAVPEKIYEYPFSSVSKFELIDEPTDNSEKKKLRQKLGLRDGIVVLGVGSFISRKNYKFLIENWSSMPDNIILCLVGEGEEYSDYIKIINKENINNIIIVPHQKKEKLADYYKVSDLFLHPANYEIWGLVINEAMSFGLPIITTNKCNAGMELIKDGENGYIVEPNDFSSIKEKIELLINDTCLMEEIKYNNLEKINKYTIENMAKIHIDIFEHLNKVKIADS